MDNVKRQIVKDHKLKLDRLVSYLEGLSIDKVSISSIKIIVTDNEGNSREVELEGDQLDTYLIFQPLIKTAVSRSEQLDKILNMS